MKKLDTLLIALVPCGLIGCGAKQPITEPSVRKTVQQSVHPRPEPKQKTPEEAAQELKAQIEEYVEVLNAAFKEIEMQSKSVDEKPDSRTGG